MATKTISIELDAYEKLRQQRLHPKESFSSVVRRGRWPTQTLTGSALLDLTEQRRQCGELLSDAELDELDRAQEKPRRSSSKWE